MKLLGQILLACLLIAAFEYALALLAVAFVIALIVGLVFEPANTICIVVFLFVLKAVEAAPLWTVGVIVALGGIVLIAGRKQRPGVPSKPVALLPPPSAADNEP